MLRHFIATMLILLVAVAGLALLPMPIVHQILEAIGTIGLTCFALLLASVLVDR